MGAAVALIALVLGLVHRPSLVGARLRTLTPSGRVWRRMAPASLGGPPVVLATLIGAVVMAVWARVDYRVEIPALPVIAGAVVGWLAATLAVQRIAERSDWRTRSRLVQAVGTLAADLRAGQQPAEALAAAEHLGSHRSIAAVRAVSERSGAPAAMVLDRVEQDLRSREAQSREVMAQLAGPRSTAVLLAILPALGIGLGVAMGARPLTVLLGQPRGQLALVAGVVLEAAGILWTDRIVAAAQGSR
jgi:tight adherence protein B